MKNCNNCLWYDQCDHTERCEYYYPLENSEQYIRNEYEKALQERVEEYKDIVNELEN